MKTDLKLLIRRAVYILGGVAFIALAIKDHIWWIALPGLYFAAMGIFGFGCASGACDLPNNETTEQNKI